MFRRRSFRCVSACNRNFETQFRRERMSSKFVLSTLVASIAIFVGAVVFGNEPCAKVKPCEPCVPAACEKSDVEPCEPVCCEKKAPRGRLFERLFALTAKKRSSCDPCAPVEPCAPAPCEKGVKPCDAVAPKACEKIAPPPCVKAEKAVKACEPAAPKACEAAAPKACEPAEPKACEKVTPPPCKSAE